MLNASAAVNLEQIGGATVGVHLGSLPGGWICASIGADAGSWPATATIPRAEANVAGIGIGIINFLIDLTHDVGWDMVAALDVVAQGSASGGSVNSIGDNLHCTTESVGRAISYA